MSKKSGCSRGRSTEPKLVRRGLELGLARVIGRLVLERTNRGVQVLVRMNHGSKHSKADKGGDLFPARALMLGVSLT